MTECPNCGFIFEEEEEKPKVPCPICKELVEDKLAHLRITHDIQSTNHSSQAAYTTTYYQRLICP